jgi:hypothetical protein
MAGAGDSRPRTAAQWCRERRLAVAINMGMFETDRRTNTAIVHVDSFSAS